MLNIEKGVVGTWFQVFAKPSVRVIPENSKEAPVRNEAARLLLEESVETLHSSASGLISAEGLAFFVSLGRIIFLYSKKRELCRNQKIRWKTRRK